MGLEQKINYQLNKFPVVKKLLREYIRLECMLFQRK